MSLESLRFWSENRLQVAMAANHPSVPVQFQNAPFQQPETAFIQFWLLDGKSFFCNVGTLKVDRHVGLFQIDVYVPENTGTSQANMISEFVGKLFRGQVTQLADGAKLVTQSPQFSYNGRSGTGYSRIMVRVPYHRDEPLA